jgi:flagellar L-ring protein precursor FlgH
MKVIDPRLGAVPAVLLAALLAHGCAHHPMPVLGNGGGAARTAQAMEAPAGPDYEPGSLWATDRAGSLFEDTRARRVGDLVMVRVEENASGTKEAETSTERSSDLSTGINAFFTAPVSGRNIDVGVTNSYDGTGSTSRSGQLSALVAAVVTEVLPNGNLVIEGNREIQVNDELQMIRLSGVVRPVDISTANIVLSSRIADAQITYTGVGTIDEKQRPGWFARLFDYLTPF